MKKRIKLTLISLYPGAEAKGENGFDRLSPKANGITRDMADYNFIN